MPISQKSPDGHREPPATAVHHPMLLAGAWFPGIDVMEVRDPEDSRLVGTVPRATLVDADRAIASAFKARATAKAMPVHHRMAILTRAADLVTDDAEAFAALIASEGIKTIREARLEVARCAMTLRLSAEEASRLGGETVAFGQRPGSEGRTGYTFREPVGVVLAITPFNDPLNLVAHKIGPAIAAGNAIILKPHEQTPLTALRLARLLERAGLPDGVLQVITGEGREIGPTLVSDPRIRMVSFTGGRLAGEAIIAAAGLKKLSLELGGNCPSIVMPDADLAQAVAACASGAFWAAGQNCLHVQRIYAHRSVYDAFRDGLIARAAAYRTGPKRDEATDMGCLIDEAAASRVSGLVRSAQSAGARILTGGGRDRVRIEPTVLEAVPEDHGLVRDEVFGPVTVMAPFDTLDQAIALANAPDYGLQAAIFTADLETALDAVERLEAGAVIVNDSTDVRIDAMPFGGVKGSGIGREGVRSAALDMTEVKLACFTRRC